MSISYSYQRTDLFPRQLLKDNILHNNEKTSRRQEFTYENPSFGQLVLISCDWFSSNSRVKRWALTSRIKRINLRSYHLTFKPFSWSCGLGISVYQSITVTFLTSSSQRLDSYCDSPGSYQRLDLFMKD